MFLVGDGGNDVSMIQAANVGVGIVGKVSTHHDLCGGLSEKAFLQMLIDKTMLIWFFLIALS